MVRNTLSGATAILCADLPFAILFLGLIFVIAAPIAPILLIILPVFVFVAWRSGAVMADANRAERETTQTRDGLIAEMIAGRSTIKALALDRAMRPLWEQKHADNIENSIVRGGKADAYTNLGATLSLVTTISLTAVGAFFIMRQEMTMGSLIATNMLSGRLLGPLNQLVGQWRSFNGFRQAVERLGQLFTAPSERETSDIQLERPRGEIGIENVTYGYNPEAAPVVDDVNLTIRACSIHAMVGRNGSGKTTLLKLIQGLYPPTEGRVLLDGADISQFTRAQLADWIGYVPQECVLFAGSVRDNVAHRHPDADDENVIKAATAAGVHEFIIDLPDGYGTDIGEAGRRLSGGQRQRIAIARAAGGRPAGSSAGRAVGEPGPPGRAGASRHHRAPRQGSDRDRGHPQPDPSRGLRQPRRPRPRQDRACWAVEGNPAAAIRRRARTAAGAARSPAGRRRGGERTRDQAASVTARRTR